MRAVTIPLAALMIGLAGAAVAAPNVAGADLGGVRPDLADHQLMPVSGSHEPHLPPSCIGLSAGTAHASCGTATGGPVGGLF